MFEEFQSVIFSNLFEHNTDVMARFSPKGDKFATANQLQLLIWDVDSKSIIHKFISDYPIDSMEWSPNSELIYCCMCKNTILQVWNILIPEWRWKVSDCVLPFIDIYWAPDSQHLLVISEFYIKVNIWSLVSRMTTTLENTKPIKNCFSFSTCGKYLAVIERIAAEDSVAIYSSHTWGLLKFFNVETTDTTGIHFSPNDLVIAVSGSAIEECKILFYSIDGRLLGKFDKPSHSGITSISWSPNGKFIALGSYSGEVTILQSSSYQEIVCYDHPETIDSENIVVYKAMENSSELCSPVSVVALSHGHLYKVDKERPISVSSLINLSEKCKTKNIKPGVQNLQYSADGHYIATVCGHQPNMICIFDKWKLKLSSIILHCYKIKSITWHPEKVILAVCTGTATLDIWTPSCYVSLFTPFKDEFSIYSANWCSNKECMIINGKEKFSVLNF